MRYILLVALSVALAACTLTIDLSGYAGDPEPEPCQDCDGGSDTGPDVPQDSGAPSVDAPYVVLQANDADATAPSGLAPNGGFELGDCEGWTTAGATAARDPVARSGTYSCRVCATTTGRMTLSAMDLDVAPRLGERYHLRGHVRSAPDAGAAVGWAAVVETGIDNRYGVGVNPGATWSPIEVVYTVGVDGGAPLIGYFNTNVTGPIGRCALFDDVTLERLP